MGPAGVISGGGQCVVDLLHSSCLCTFWQQHPYFPFNFCKQFFNFCFCISFSFKYVVLNNLNINFFVSAFYREISIIPYHMSANVLEDGEVQVIVFYVGSEKL